MQFSTGEDRTICIFIKYILPRKFVIMMLHLIESLFLQAAEVIM